MDFFTTASIVIVLSALFGYINVKFLKLPNTIGLMVIAIAFTLLLFASSQLGDVWGPWLFRQAETLVRGIDFNVVLLDIMLGFLLFAGAMHTNFGQLHVQRWPVLVFSTLGVLVSTFIVGMLTYFSFRALGLDVRWIHCLLFGALISPTDPIAVLGILKKAGVPKKLETKIVGESLFNDGVGVVLFLTIMSIATGGATEHVQTAPATNSATEIRAVSFDIVDHQQHDDPQSDEQGTAKPEFHVDENDQDDEGFWESVGGVIRLFLVEVLGGILFGLVAGTLTYGLLKSIDDYEIEVMITLACVMGGYALAHRLGLSAPLAIVVAGLIVGNDTARGTSMSKETEQYVDKFWELIDILLNAILFVLIGLEMLILEISRDYIIAGLIAIPIVLFARFASLIVPVAFFSKRLDFVPYTSTIMAWGGLAAAFPLRWHSAFPRT